MINQDNKKNVFSFGDFLRKKREEKGISLEKLESLTKIKKTILFLFKTTELKIY